MSSRKLSRERGTTITCDYGCYEGEEPECASSVYTALVKVTSTRTYAASLGWIRGGQVAAGATTARSTRLSSASGSPRWSA